MATLTSALNYALGGLSVTSAQSAIVSRNVSFASDPDYTRKSAQITTLVGGTPVVSGYARSTDKQLLDKLLDSTSSAAGTSTLSEALGRLSALTGDPQSDQSLSWMVGELQRSLRAAEADPSTGINTLQAFRSAQAVAEKIRGDAAEIASIRSDADQGVKDSVARLNSLLAQFKVTNDAIVRGQGTSADLSEMLDQRDGLLKLMSEEIGIRTVTRQGNDMQIYADGGAVLFQGKPRAVTIGNIPLSSGAGTGSAVYIDGVAVTTGASPMAVKSGRIAALTEVRDSVAATAARQLDAVAAGLISAFRERSQVGGGPDVPGLFVGTGGELPDPSAPPSGLGARLSVNSLADPEQGGAPALIRDGGFGGSNYIYNTSGNSGFQLRLRQQSDAMDALLIDDKLSGSGKRLNLIAYTTQSAAWVEVQRQSIQQKLDTANAVQTRASESLQRVTGVSIDQEMAVLLDLEKTYQASSKIISVVDSMLSNLLQAVG